MQVLPVTSMTAEEGGDGEAAVDDDSVMFDPHQLSPTQPYSDQQFSFAPSRQPLQPFSCRTRNAPYSPTGGRGAGEAIAEATGRAQQVEALAAEAANVEVILEQEAAGVAGGSPAQLS